MIYNSWNSTSLIRRPWEEDSTMFMHNKRLMYTVRVGEPHPALAARTESDTEGNPVTGADLGAGPGAGSTTEMVDD